MSTMKPRFFLVLALVMVLGLLPAGPAAAGTTRTPFSGIAYIVGEDWTTGEYWVPDGAVVFWRGVTFYLAMEVDDARVAGRICAIHNGNYWPSPDDPVAGVQGQMWGTMRIETDGDEDCTNSPDYWEGTFVGDRDRYGNEYSRNVLKGYGAYEGLQLRFEWWSAPTDWYNTVEGEVMDPGGK
jgi:hypothetical protein